MSARAGRDEGIDNEERGREVDIDTGWQLEIDPEKTSEVAVRFTAAGWGGLQALAERLKA